jgi:hypothetical protein
MCRFWYLDNNGYVATKEFTNAFVARAYFTRNGITIYATSDIELFEMMADWGLASA